MHVFFMRHNFSIFSFFQFSFESVGDTRKSVRIEEPKKMLNKNTETDTPRRASMRISAKKGNEQMKMVAAHEQSSPEETPKSVRRSVAKPLR